MIWLFILTGYLLGWFPAAVISTRFLANREHCHYYLRYGRNFCQRNHSSSCWAIEGLNFLTLVQGMGLGFIWPLALLTYGVYAAASRPTRPKPIPRVLSERELAQLEVAAGIKPRGVEGIDYNTPFDRPYTVR